MYFPGPLLEKLPASLSATDRFILFLIVLSCNGHGDSSPVPDVTLRVKTNLSFSEVAKSLKTLKDEYYIKESRKTKTIKTYSLTSRTIDLCKEV